MFVLLLCTALLTTPVDEFCQQTYGHPGDLGVTPDAKQYFNSKTTYAEAVATIGQHAEEVPGDDQDTQVYRWQNGNLEMHFRNNQLSKFRMDKIWTNVSVPVDNSPKQQNTLAQQPTTAASEQESNDQAQRQEYREFQQTLEKVIQAGSGVAENDLERGDIQTLKFLLPKLNQAVADGNWKQAAQIRDKMKVALQRAQVVASDAQSRLTEKQRADEERRHKEEMQQRQRQHQELLNGLRYRGGY